MERNTPGVPRRRLLGWSGAAAVMGAATGAGTIRTLDGGAAATTSAPASSAKQRDRLRPYDRRVAGGRVPQGLASRVPAFGQVLALDLSPRARRSSETARGAARRLLRDLTALSRRTEEEAASGSTGAIRSVDAAVAGLDIRPASLQVTPGIGASLLTWCGLQHLRPAAFVDVPSFANERLADRMSGGDLLVQIGAEDPMKLAGAVQQVGALLDGDAVVRWSRRGFRSTSVGAEDPGATTRNLMGHRDGTNNPGLATPLWESTVLVNDAGSWMDQGSYLVVRQIRIDLGRWFDRPTDARDGVIGRRTSDGAPLSGTRETDDPDLDLRTNGRPVIPTHAHIRQASTRNTRGARIYRRGWNFDDGWTADGKRDAGLLFLAWQSDLRRGFIPIQQSLIDGNDALNAFTTHIGSAVFAVPALPEHGNYVGQALLEA